MSPGGGLSTDGTPTLAGIWHMQIVRHLRSCQASEIAYAQELLSREPAGSKAKISLVSEAGKLKIHVEISRDAS